MKTLVRSNDGEPAIWWSWQDLRGGADRKGGNPLGAPTGICTNGRAWLYWPGNRAGVQWVLFSRRCALGITFSSTDDDAISVALSIPFLFAIYLSLGRARWIERLPGVKWVNGDFESGEREIQITVHHGAIWWRLWRNPMVSDSNDWRDGCFHIDDFLLGRSVYSESRRDQFETFIEMPEGAYPATIELYTATWRRVRWPWAKTVQRANIEIPGGIPVPGKGENSWDMDDNAIESMTCCAADVEGAKADIRESAMRDRRRYAGEGWTPDAGWPAHCLRGAP